MIKMTSVGLNSSQPMRGFRTCPSPNEAIVGAAYYAARF